MELPPGEDDFSTRPDATRLILFFGVFGVFGVDLDLIGGLGGGEFSSGSYSDAVGE